MCLLLKTELQQFTFIRLHFYFFNIPLRFSSEMHRYFSHHTGKKNHCLHLRHLVASRISPVQSSSNTNPSPTSRTYRSITRTNTNEYL